MTVRTDTRSAALVEAERVGPDAVLVPRIAVHLDRVAPAEVVARQSGLAFREPDDRANREPSHAVDLRVFKVRPIIEQAEL